MLLEFCLEKELYLSNTWFRFEENGKVTFRICEYEIEIIIVLIKKEHRRHMRKVKAIRS